MLAGGGGGESARSAWLLHFGTADYTAALIGQAPFFVEVNHQMPRTQGLNQVHISQVLGYCERDAPLIAIPPTEPSEKDRQIAELIVERIPNGATLQVGVGGIPNAVLASLRDHRDLGVHTEMLSDGVVDLVERGIVTGTRKKLRPNKIVRRSRSAAPDCTSGCTRTTRSSSCPWTTSTTRESSPKSTR